MKYLLGIDVGTTGTKTLLFRQDGLLCGHAYKAYKTSNPRLGFCEQDPNDWWQAVTETVRRVAGTREIAENVSGISLSVQGGTLVPVDAEFSPVRPAIVWNDVRCQRERDEWLSSFGTDGTMYRRTGWHLLPGLNAMQIRHMRREEPELFEKTAMFLSVPDYISYKMTGIPALDLSNIGINQLGDITKGQYDPEILAFAGITRERLAGIIPSGRPVGRLCTRAAEELGLTPDAVFVSGAHDQYAVALGAGACRAGDILIGSGTCWVITCIGDRPDFSSGLSQSAAAVPGKWGSLWSLSSGGVCLEWLRKNIMSGEISFAELDREASSRKAAEDGLFFFPFSGRATLEKSFRKGSFLGLDLAHDRFHMARAVMEGVAFQITWMLDAFRLHSPESGLKLAGGASKSSLWSHMTADISGLPVRIPEVADLACVGAAILAGVGSGIYSSAEEGCKALCVGEKTILPDPGRAQLYKPLLEEYKRCAEILGSAYRC